MSTVPEYTAMTLYSEVDDNSLQGTLSRPLLRDDLEFARLCEVDFC